MTVCSAILSKLNGLCWLVNGLLWQLLLLWGGNNNLVITQCFQLLEEVLMRGGVRSEARIARGMCFWASTSFCPLKTQF